MPSRLLAAVALAGTVGCAHAAAVTQIGPGSPGYVAPSRLTVVGESEPAIDVQELFITNNSTVSIIVTGVQVNACVNVTPCGLVPLRIRVDPTQRRRVLSVRPAVPAEAYSYRWTYSWSGAPAP